MNPLVPPVARPSRVAAPAHGPGVRAPVVVAVGSLDDRPAALHGVLAASRLALPLVLVHACRPEDAGAAAALLRVAAGWCHALRPDVPVMTERHHADPAAADSAQGPGSGSASGIVAGLVQAAGEAHLLVLGRRRERSGEPSTCASLAAALDVPIVSVPHGWSGSGEHGVVVAGFDGTTESAHSLREAVRAARLEHRALVLVAAGWHPAPLPLEVDRRLDVLAAGAEAALERAGGDAVEAEVVVRSGRPSEILLEAAQRADLVVLGRHHPAIPRASRLGPTARSVLSAAPCPVLLTAPQPYDSAPRPERSRLPGGSSHAVPV